MNRRSTICLSAGVLAATVLALTPQAQARETAKFKVISVSGSETVTRDAVYEPSEFDFTSCALSQTGHIRFHSTKQAAAYAFTSKAHGRARVAWSKPTFTGNFSVVEVPGEVTSRARPPTSRPTMWTRRRARPSKAAATNCRRWTAGSRGRSPPP